MLALLISMRECAEVSLLQIFSLMIKCKVDIWGYLK